MVHPTDHTSHAVVVPVISMISGAIQYGVPTWLHLLNTKFNFEIYWKRTFGFEVDSIHHVRVDIAVDVVVVVAGVGSHFG